LENLNSLKMKPGTLILFLLLSQTMTSQARTVRYQPEDEQRPDFSNFHHFLSQILHSNDIETRDSAENVSTF
jgi:hypothetical protein